MGIRQKEGRMNARTIITKRLNHEGTDVTPYAFSFEPELYRRLTEHYRDENWERKKLRAFTCSYLYVNTHMLRPINSVYSKDGYGAIWRMDRKPWHLVKPPLSEPSLIGYDFPKAETFTQPILDNKETAIRKFNENNELYRIINMGCGIFEHSWRMRGFENTLTDMITDEDFYAEVTEKITDLYLAMIAACDGVPADAYMLGDDWGDQRGVIFGPERWRKFLKPCWAMIYAAIHRQGKKTIHHSCGSIARIYDDLIEIGMDCHESVQPEARDMAPDVVKAKWGRRLSFWGCLGSQGILNSGTPKEIRAEIFRLHNLFKDEGGFVLAPAKPLMDEMDIDRAAAVVETLSELGGL